VTKHLSNDMHIFNYKGKRPSTVSHGPPSSTGIDFPVFVEMKCSQNETYYSEVVSTRRNSTCHGP